MKDTIRILIVPMAAMAETAGPVSRCTLLAEELKKAGMETATCMAKDVNFREIKDVRNYRLDVPMPLGLPAFIARRTFPMAQKLGITQRKTVRSFDEVLKLTGNLDYGYLKRSVEQISEAIDDFKPDVVYSEFNISAIIAAKYKGVKLAATVSFPTQHEYANDPKLATGLNRLLSELKVKEQASALELFELADLRFCLSIKELEPLDSRVVFCGVLKDVLRREAKRNKVLVYMGNGTVSAEKTAGVIKEAFKDTAYEVYFATAYLPEKTEGNLHIAKRWDFNTMLDESVLFINHGGQNSIADGLIHAVPQIVLPGKVFERRYNAKMLKENKAGVCMSADDFTADRLRHIAEKVIASGRMRENAKLLGDKLLNEGGIELIAGSIKEILCSD